VLNLNQHFFFLTVNGGKLIFVQYFPGKIWHVQTMYFFLNFFT